MLETEETPAATEGQDGSQEEPAAEAEATVVDDTTTEDGVSQEKTSDQFDWSSYENAERYAGRTLQDLINYTNQRDYLYGQQSNELGELRRAKAELDALRMQVSGQRTTETRPKFSEAETIAFSQKLQDNPLEAILEYAGPKLLNELKNQLMPELHRSIEPTLRTHAQDVASQQEFNAFLRSHGEDYSDHRDMMFRLMQNDYLGDNAPYEEVYQLAKMAKSEKTLFPVTCSLMQRGVSFKEAKEYASLKKNAAAAAKQAKDQIKGEVSSISGGTKHTTKKSGTKEPEIRDMDDAFDID